MPIKTACPDCDRPYTLADTMVGKTVKCKECGNSFTVQAAANGIAAQPSNGKTKTGLSATTKTIKGRKRRDDDDEEAPKKGGLGMWLLIGGGAAALLLVLMCGGVAVLALALSGSASKDSGDSNLAQSGAPTLETKPAVPVPPPMPVQIPNPMPQPVPMLDPMPQPMPTTTQSLVTKENFDKIMARMSSIQVQGILGLPTNPNATVDPTVAGTLGNKAGTAQMWQNGADSVTVTYAANRTVIWVGVFDGQTYTQSDPNYGTKPNPNATANTKVTKANYDMLQLGTTYPNVAQVFGNPNNTQQRNVPATKTKPAHVFGVAVWNDGQGGEMTLEFTNGLLTKKNERGLK
jgi:Domain of Unknown Function with PDB structure (DUF3862)